MRGGMPEGAGEDESDPEPEHHRPAGSAGDAHHFGTSPKTTREVVPADIPLAMRQARRPRGRRSGECGE